MSVSASVLLLVLVNLAPAVDGWAVGKVDGLGCCSSNEALIRSKPFSLLRPPTVRPSSAVRLTCQMNPVEKMATNLRESFAGVGSSQDENYHLQRIKYHEDRMLHHEERMAFHRAQLSKKKTARMDVQGGSYEERLRIGALSTGRPMQILFVDLSNTCRSPAAEAIMRTMIDDAKLQEQIIVRSCSTGAGTREWFKKEVAENIEVERVDPRMVTHASKRGLSHLAGRQSVQLTKSELTSADLIVIMDKNNEKEVRAAASYWGEQSCMSKVRLMSTYCRTGTITTDIPDPYYGGASSQQQQGQVFEKVLDLLHDGCKGLLRDCAPQAV